MGDHSPKPIWIYPFHSFYKHAKRNSIVGVGRSGYVYYKRTSTEISSRKFYLVPIWMFWAFPLALSHRTVYQGHESSKQGGEWVWARETLKWTWATKQIYTTQLACFSSVQHVYTLTRRSLVLVCIHLSFYITSTLKN